MSGRTPHMLFADPRLRPRVQDARPFLIEAAVDQIWDMDKECRRPGREFNILKLAAMCDEDGTMANLALQVSGARFDFDRKYLARIWPNLFTLPVPIQVGRNDQLCIATERRAVVVLVGAWMADPR